MFQFSKNEHLTLPSVENWNTNTNILKLPPQAVFTRRRDKVGDDLQITAWIDESGDRVCEGISKFARGINPMVSVSYSNYNAGTNGNPLTYSGKTEAKLPYRVMDNGAFRPPILTQQDLLPLSRLPRNKTSVVSSPEFPNYLKKIENPTQMRSVKKEVIKTSVRPSAYLKFDHSPCHLAESKYSVKDQLIVSANSGLRTLDIKSIEEIKPVKEIVDDVIRANVTVQYGSNLTEKRSIDNSHFNTTKYINDDTLNGNMTTNISGHTKNIETKGFDRGVKDDIAIISYTPNIYGHTKNIETKGFDRGVKDDIAIISYTPNVRGNDKVEHIYSDIELDRKMPLYQMNSNIIDSKRRTNLSHTNEIILESKTQGSAVANIGGNSMRSVDNITNRNLNLRPSLQKGGFENKGFIPTTQKDNMMKKLNNTKSEFTKRMNIMNKK